MATQESTHQIAASIPPFTGSGVLPPFVGPDPARQAGVAPYESTLAELVVRFGTTDARKAILRGFLAHRQRLLGFGIFGVQWLDGSFVEDVEVTRNCDPGDIDVVTFFERPKALQPHAAWEAFVGSNLDVFSPAETKAAYSTDSYFVDVSFGPLHVIEQATYWYGLFSHQRMTGLWKGLLKIYLDQQRDDTYALHLLNAI